MTNTSSWIKDLTLLTLIIGALFTATLGKYPTAAPDGARYSEIPREMVVDGDYLTPHLNGVKYFEKPPLFYWMQAASFKIFGINDFAAGIVNALMALATALCVYVTSRKLFGRLEGLLSSFIFTTTALVFALSRLVTLDVTLTFFMTASLCSFILATKLPLGIKRSSHLWLMYIFAACAVMTKGLVGVGFLGLIIAIWITLFNQWRNLKTYHLISGTIIFLLIALPWHILVQIKNPEFLKFYFIEEHFLRYFTDYARRHQKWWFLPVLTTGGLYPWLVFLPQSIIHNVRKIFTEFKQSTTTVFLFIWILTIYIIFSFSKSKLIHYIVPIFPPLAMIIGNYLADYWQSDKKISSVKFGFYASFIFNIILGIGAFAATFILDFNEHAITKHILYLVASAAIISTFITTIIYYQKGLPAGFISILLGTTILFFCINPVITTINRQSIKPLIETLKETLKPEDEVMAYGNYYQDLPYYLNRIITVVNFHGELGFGVHHQDTSNWMIDPTTFWKRWNSDRKIYAIARIGFYNQLKSIAADKIHVLAILWDTYLITNKK